ncbi:hypothetical protein SEA_LIGMA_5 [Gordonia phage Ligma]|nr:hypothetical protein SEA_LIGMA_5 [Gordonia phage Ligma]UQT02106.1 hypothetical protein SEA_AXUMITE_5 [Gordonia phage Axumite]
MRGITLRILGQEVFEFYVGTPSNDGTEPEADSAATAGANLTATTERPFGFIPAGVEFDKPQPE